MRKPRHTGAHHGWYSYLSGLSGWCSGPVNALMWCIVCVSHISSISRCIYPQMTYTLRVRNLLWLTMLLLSLCMPYQTHQTVKGRFCVQSAPCICFRSVLTTTEEAKKTFKRRATRDRFMMRNNGDVKQTGHRALQSPQHPQISLCFCFSPGNMSVKRGLNYFAGYLASCSLHDMFWWTFN